MFPRILENRIREKLGGGKAIVLVGTRQVGKTTLIKRVLNGLDYLFLDADDPTTRSMLTNPNTEQIQTMLADSRVVFLDESLRI
jgi:hypothetical protein